MSLLAATLDVLFPPRCAACGELVQAVERPLPLLVFCVPCGITLEPIVDACEACGVPLDGRTGCASCREHPQHFDGASAAYLYGGAIAKVLHAYKYEDRPELAGPLAERLARLALPESDVVVPVPLHDARRRSRTYDQALYLARELAVRKGWVLEPTLLKRRRATERQVGQSREARALNVSGAFEVAGIVKGKRVLLVDDVVTTGATASECAAALRSAGAASVHVVSVARAA